MSMHDLSIRNGCARLLQYSLLGRFAMSLRVYHPQLYYQIACGRPCVATSGAKVSRASGSGQGDPVLICITWFSCIIISRMQHYYEILQIFNQACVALNLLVLLFCCFVVHSGRKCGNRRTDTLRCLKLQVNTNYNGRTLLHIAAAEGWTNCVRVLLKHGADIRKRVRNTLPCTQKQGIWSRGKIFCTLHLN